MSTPLPDKKAREGFERNADPWSSPAEGLASSLRAFGLELLQKESARKPKQNVFISPLSVFLALAMIKNGAAGVTERAMRRTLALPSYPSDAAINDAIFSMMRSLQSQVGVDLAIANALWADVRFTFPQEFVRLSESIYEAPVCALDFTQPSAAFAINEWISQRTRGNIRGIVSAPDLKDARVLVTNAVYFKGNFSEPFLKEMTKRRAFYVVDGQEKLVPMMQGQLRGSYRSGNKFEAAALRYRGSTIALFVLLPEKGTRPEEMMTVEGLKELLVEHSSIDVDLSLPRFNIEFATQLKESLEQMGMGIAFKHLEADFSPMNGQEFFISEVAHKTKLEVDEEGTIAAAATAAMECLGSSVEPVRRRLKTLVINRPYSILLADTATGVVLFAGAIYEP